MKNSALRLGLTSLVPLVAVLAVLGCGGGSSSSGDCSRLCTQLTECATTLDTTIGTLVGDGSVNAGNCVSECSSNTGDCADKSGLFSCLDAISCTSVVDVQDGFLYCIDTNCEPT
jgi:hypothetical protein